MAVAVALAAGSELADPEPKGTEPQAARLAASESARTGMVARREDVGMAGGYGVTAPA